jgi:hypothetical protein
LDDYILDLMADATVAGRGDGSDDDSKGDGDKQEAVVVNNRNHARECLTRT